MQFRNARQDFQFILSWFREGFSSPSFRLFSVFVIGFTRVGKGHTSSKVQSLDRFSLSRFFSSFIRFLEKNAWVVDETLDLALQYFFHTFKIQVRSIVFLLLDKTIIQETGKKIPECGGFKDYTQNVANVFDYQWILEALRPLASRLYHLKGAQGFG